MRTIKELLILLREEMEVRFAGCICYCAANMAGRKLITYDEFHALEDYINSHRPEDTKDRIAIWWPYGELAPRLEFLDKLIAEIDGN